MALPKNPAMLLSVVNTQLRDNYDSFEEMADNLDEDREEIESILNAAGYHYDSAKNRFV